VEKMPKSKKCSKCDKSYHDCVYAPNCKCIIQDWQCRCGLPRENALPYSWVCPCSAKNCQDKWNFLLESIGKSLEEQKPEEEKKVKKNKKEDTKEDTTAGLSSDSDASDSGEGDEIDDDDDDDDDIEGVNHYRVFHCTDCHYIAFGKTGKFCDSCNSWCCKKCLRDSEISQIKQPKHPNAFPGKVCLSCLIQTWTNHGKYLRRKSDKYLADILLLNQKLDELEHPQNYSCLPTRVSDPKPSASGLVVGGLSDSSLIGSAESLPLAP
jgi:hypothetical protein